MQGTVNKVSTNGKAWNAMVGDTWYGFGFNKPEFQEGQVIEFEFEQRGKFKNIRPDTVRILGSTSGSSSPAASGSPKNSYDDRNISIAYQSSRKDALQLVQILVESQAVPLPTKKAEQADAILALVEHYTAHFFLKLEDVVKDGGVSVEDMLPSGE